MSNKNKGVKFNLLEEEEHKNPLVDNDEGKVFESMVVQANKKTKKKDKVVAKAKQVPKPTKEGVKKQTKRVGKALADNLTPGNIEEFMEDGPVKGVGNVVTDIFLGIKPFPESPKMETVHRMLKKNYELLKEQLGQVEDYVNKCCSEKNGVSLVLQKSDYDKMFEQEQELVKKERRDKYVNVAKATVRQTKRTVHRVDKDLKEGLLKVSPISEIIKRFVNPGENINIFEILKSIMIHIRSGRDLSELSPEQDMVVNDLRELIQYSNDNPDTSIKKKPPGLRLSDIVRLIFGYYIYRSDNGEVVAHVTNDLIDGQSFGNTRYDMMKNEEIKKDFINMFHILFGVKKGSMRSTLGSIVSNQIPNYSIIIQRLYDRGGKKKIKTFKKRKKHKSKK